MIDLRLMEIRMKRKTSNLCSSLSLMLFIFISNSALATWQVAKPQAYAPAEPFFQAGKTSQPRFMPPVYSSTAFPKQFANFGASAPHFAVTINGSLKENLERIMRRYHWRVVWNAPYDYNFDGKIAGSSLPNVVEKLLKPFPLQAVMYNANRTLAISAKYS